MNHLFHLFCLWLRVGTQACPRCLRLAPAEGRTAEKAESPYLPPAATQQGRSPPRAAPLGKVKFRAGVKMERFIISGSGLLQIYGLLVSALLGETDSSVSSSPSSRGRRAAELGGAADLPGPRRPHLPQRHHPHAQVLPHLVRQRERRQAPVPPLLSEADPAHGVPAAPDVPGGHQDRLHQPQPPALLASRRPAGGAQLSDRR